MRYKILNLQNNLKLKLRNSTVDEHIIQEIYFLKSYTPPDFFINESDKVIDIGAHAGYFSVFAASFAKKGTVYSYEPFPENFQLLRDNIHLNNLTNVEAFNLGIATKKVKRNLFISETNTGGHSLFCKTNNFIPCNFISLKEVFDSNNIERCNFLKIDTEGAELEILSNLPKGYFKKNR